ncbi:hypothetical protein TURU_142535 [Turdus rufiventris]|nr:hypothetical protein TURU_142535 [Turdus rufiventris]
MPHWRLLHSAGQNPREGNDSLQTAQSFLPAVFQEELVSLAKQSDLLVRKVDTWFGHQCTRTTLLLMKKFWRGQEQIIHIAAITLIFVFCCANMIQFGMIIMLVHYASDYILEVHYPHLEIMDSVIEWFGASSQPMRLACPGNSMKTGGAFLLQLSSTLGTHQPSHCREKHLILKRRDARSDNEESDRRGGEDLAKKKEHHRASRKTPGSRQSSECRKAEQGFTAVCLKSRWR